MATAPLEALAERLKWPYIRSAEEGGLTRTQRVRDILSAFRKDILPEEFRTDLVELGEDKDDHISQERRRNPEQCVVQGDFEATIFRLAVHDDNVFTSLCKAMPAGASAAIYFNKMLERSKTVLAELDRYCQNLGQTSSKYEDERDVLLSISIALETIKDNARNIRRNIRARAPHGLQEAANTHITLIEDICMRNVDILAGNIHGRTTLTNDGDEDEDFRNIYHQLIERPASSYNDYYILDALGDLPSENLHPFRERLRDIVHRVEVSRAPRGFTSKLGRIFRDVESGSRADIVEEHATSGAEGAEEERGQKRARTA